MDDADVAAIFGELAEGTEEGLGEWKAVGFFLQESSLVELIRYKHCPGPPGYVVRVDRSG